jgi:hypothetical protein
VADRWPGTSTATPFRYRQTQGTGSNVKSTSAGSISGRNDGQRIRPRRPFPWSGITGFVWEAEEAPAADGGGPGDRLISRTRPSVGDLCGINQDVIVETHYAGRGTCSVNGTMAATTNGSRPATSTRLRCAAPQYRITT